MPSNTQYTNEMLVPFDVLITYFRVKEAYLQGYKRLISDSSGILKRNLKKQKTNIEINSNISILLETLDSNSYKIISHSIYIY